MRQFTTLFKKELLEAWSSFKLLWMPLVFLLLGITDPIMNYFMEDILATVGNLPDGFEMIFPELTAVDILMASTGQFQSIGIIIFVAIFASAISRERQMGTATLIYVRPIRFTSYFMSKWAMAAILAVICVVLGYLGSMYYTYLLYGGINMSTFLIIVATYIIWLLFVVSFTLAMSATFSTAISMTISIVIMPIGVMISSLIGSHWTYSPWRLVDYSYLIMKDEIIWQHYLITLLITTLLMVLCIVLGIQMSKKNAYKTNV